MATGDRPNFPLTNQRLDKVDIEAISDLIAENTMRTIGAILGPCGGLLSDVVTTYDGLAGTLTIGACRLGYSHYASGSTTAYDGGVVRWDPDYVVGGDAVDISSFGTTAGSEGYVFFQRSELEYDEDNRAYYDALAQEKKVGVANTRIREIAVFNTAPTYDGLSRDDGWFPFLCLKWSVTGGDPTVYKISAFDDFSGGVLYSQVVRGRTGGAGLGISWNQGHVGVARLMREVVGSVQHAYDSDFSLSADGSVDNNINDLTYRWSGYGLPRGLNQLNADLTTAENDIATLQGDVTTAESNITAIDNRANRTPVLYAQTVNASNEIVSQSSYIGTLPFSTNERTSTGVWQIDFVGDSFGCSETLNLCTPVVSINNAVDGQVYWRWASEYVLEVRTRLFSAGSYSNHNLGFSLIIVKGG